MHIVLFIVAFVLLIKAADYFVDASTDIAKKFKISEIVIGATVVAIGTTLPETMVSATSALKGHGDIAFGNAIGSIICNTSLIAAISLVVAPGNVSKKALVVPSKFFFFSFAVYLIFAYFVGEFNRVAGIILIAIFVYYAHYIIKISKKNTDAFLEKDDEVKKKEETSLLKSIITIIISALVIAFASNLLVDNGIIIATMLGVPESVIGITVIALGTSLPELTTAITSLKKGHSNLSIGNIIGSNLLNILLVTGIASTLSPFKLPSNSLIMGMNATYIFDIPLAFLVMLILCMPPLITGKTMRWQGITLLIIYVCFLFYQF